MRAFWRRWNQLYDGTRGSVARGESHEDRRASRAQRGRHPLKWSGRRCSSEWRLEDWVELLTEDAIYQVPPTDVPEGDARRHTVPPRIADDATRIRSRVKQLLGKSAWAEPAFAYAPA